MNWDIYLFLVEEPSDACTSINEAACDIELACCTYYITVIIIIIECLEK